MDGNADSIEELERMIRELRADMAEIYQYYHGDPPQLQKIFDRWFPDGLSSYPFG